MMALRIILLFCVLHKTWALVAVDSNMRSFSSAIKAGFVHPNVEQTLYQHNTGEPGVITEQWFTGKGVMDENARIRIYIDQEAEASLDFMLLLAHGVGFYERDDTKYIPWGNRRIAHAADGGIYNTFRIPFGKSFRVTITRPTGGYFWYIIRGVENYPLVLGDLILPSHARLKLYKNDKVVVKPLKFLPLADVRRSSGAVFMVTLVANSSGLRFLEACFRAYIDGSNKTTWLSSGTEDFFLSAYYFNRGLYHQDNAGLTYFDHEKGVVSAYKFFENDPLLFSKSFELWWRNSELSSSQDRYGCPNTWPDPTPPRDEKFSTEDIVTEEELHNSEEPVSKHKIGTKGKVFKDGKFFDLPPFQDVTVTTYTWVYEW